MYAQLTNLNIILPSLHFIVLKFHMFKSAKWNQNTILFIRGALCLTPSLAVTAAT